MLELRDLKKTYAGRTVLGGLSHHFKAGEFVAIMGESGVGKSTLLNLIAGLDAPDSGDIVVDGQAMAALDDNAATALRTNGASAMAAFIYATLPQTLPQMLSYILYRWENNIRAAAVLGVVGAGGLGQMLKYHLSLFQMPSAATVVLAMLVLVAMVDAISFALRRALTR